MPLLLLLAPVLYAESLAMDPSADYLHAHGCGRCQQMSGQEATCYFVRQRGIMARVETLYVITDAAS